MGRFFDWVYGKIVEFLSMMNGTGSLYLTAFLQITILIAWNENMLLDCKMMPYASEAPRVGRQFSLETKTRANIMPVVYAIWSVENLLWNISASVKYLNHSYPSITWRNV